MNWATKRNRVHEETQLVKDIAEMSKWCRNNVTIARITGCSRWYVRCVKAQMKSTAHVHLSKETLKNLAA